MDRDRGGGRARLYTADLLTAAERARWHLADDGAVSDKDALDVLRLLQAIDTPTFAAGLAQLANHEISAAVTAEAVSQLAPLFGSPDSVGVTMAVRAARAGAEADVIAASFTALVSDLLTASTVGWSTNPASPSAR